MDFNTSEVFMLAGQKAKMKEKGKTTQRSIFPSIFLFLYLQRTRKTFKMISTMKDFNRNWMFFLRFKIPLVRLCTNFLGFFVRAKNFLIRSFLRKNCRANFFLFWTLNWHESLMENVWKFFSSCVLSVLEFKQQFSCTFPYVLEVDRFYWVYNAFIFMSMALFCKVTVTIVGNRFKKSKKSTEQRILFIQNFRYHSNVFETINKRSNLFGKALFSVLLFSETKLILIKTFGKT